MLLSVRPGQDRFRLRGQNRRLANCQCVYALTQGRRMLIDPLWRATKPFNSRPRQGTRVRFHEGGGTYVHVWICARGLAREVIPYKYLSSRSSPARFRRHDGHNRTLHGRTLLQSTEITSGNSLTRCVSTVVGRGFSTSQYTELRTNLTERTLPGSSLRTTVHSSNTMSPPRIRPGEIVDIADFR